MLCREVQCLDRASNAPLRKCARFCFSFFRLRSDRSMYRRFGFCCRATRQRSVAPRWGRIITGPICVCLSTHCPGIGHPNFSLVMEWRWSPGCGFCSLVVTLVLSGSGSVRSAAHPDELQIVNCTPPLCSYTSLPLVGGGQPCFS